MTSSAVSEKGISQANKSALRNPWVLGWLALVIVVLGVNIGMVTTAVVTNPGLVDKDFYEKGREFERNMLKQQAERSALGWQVKLEPAERTFAGVPARYAFTATDASGAPLRGAEVVLEAYRPSDAARDFSLPLEEVASGRYEAEVTFPLKGVWDIKVKVAQGGRNYDISRRVSVQAR